MARPAGLEPATLGLEGRCSIQMSYGRRTLLVGVEGFEPPTPCSQSRCATRLRYTPGVEPKMKPTPQKFSKISLIMLIEKLIEKFPRLTSIVQLIQAKA